MATKEEIIQQYRVDRNQKLAQLQATLSARIVQDGKEKSAIINDISVISSTLTVDNFFGAEKIIPYLNGQDSEFANKLRYNFELENSSKDQPFAYLQLTPKVYFISDTKNEAQIQISENLFLKLPDGESTRIDGSMGIPETINEITSFSELKKKLSGYRISPSQLSDNRQFRKYLDVINDNLKKNNLPDIQSFPLLVYSTITIPDGTQTNQYTSVFPKPSGLDDGETNNQTTPTTPETTTQTTTPTQTTTSSTPATPTPTQTTTPSTPATPSQTTKTSGSKYLSIEAIKDDDPIIPPSQTGKNKVLSLVYLDDGDPTTGDYQSSNEIKSIQNEKAQSESNEQPKPPTGDINTTVVKNEVRAIEESTEAQRTGENADALKPYPPKPKDETSPIGGNPELLDGRARAVEERSKPIPEDKKPDAITQKTPDAKTFIKWMTTDGQDPNGIIYRGIYPQDYSKPPAPPPPVTYGLVEKRFKNLFSFGNNLDKIFQGYSIESPVDVALLMNSGGVGRFNKNWPYMFGEGSEIHAAITRASNVSKESQGGFGTFGAGRKYNDANWAANPHWCGLCTNFMLHTNNRYKSDSEIKNITSTLSAQTYYSESPFNTFNENLKKEIDKYDKDISSKKNTLESNNNKLQKKESSLENERKKAKLKEANYRDNLDPTAIDKEKVDKDVNKFYTKVNSLEKEIDSIKINNSKIEEDIRQLEKTKDDLTKSESKKSYNENNEVALFQLGIHWNKTGGLTSLGVELWDKIKDWPGGFIVRRDPSQQGGHVETLLHFSSTGQLYTIGGNTGLDNSDGNGSEYGFKSYESISKFNGGGSYQNFYLVKRGTKNPYTNGIGKTVKQTTMYKKYVNDLKTDKELNPAAFNILRNIMEV